MYLQLGPGVDVLSGWKEGFYDFFVPQINAQGFTIAGGTQQYTLDVTLCEDQAQNPVPVHRVRVIARRFAGAGGFGAQSEEDLSVDPLPKVTACVDRAESEGVDAIVVGTSSSNDDIKTAAEAYSIPNLHCSGRAPEGHLRAPEPVASGLSSCLRQLAFRGILHGKNERRTNMAQSCRLLIWGVGGVPCNIKKLEHQEPVRDFLGRA